MIFRLFGALRARLVTLLLLVFSILVIPALVVVLTVSHFQSERAIRAHLDAELGRAKSDTNRALWEFCDDLIDVTSVVANSLAYRPSMAREDGFDEVLYGVLVQVDHILSVTVSFEDGFTRHFAKVTPELRTKRPEIPPQALWGSGDVYEGPSGVIEHSKEILYGDFPTRILTLDSAPDLPHFRQAEGYQGARQTQSAFITDVRLGSLSKQLLVSLAYPIKRDGAFYGAVTVNVAVKELSDFLYQNRVSEHSESMIIDEKGQIVAASRMANLDSTAGAIPAISSLLEGRLIEIDAIARSGDIENGKHSFTLSYDGSEYVISDFNIESEFGATYRAVIITPLNDFVGDMRRSSQNFSMVVIALLIVEALMMIRLARRLSGHIKTLSSEIARIRAMTFDAEEQAQGVRSPVHEVAELQQGVSLLQSALRSFSLYVPMGVVRKLIDEGRPIAPGVERREMTILFCDLENFSTRAQSISAESLLEDTTTYFSIATEAITRHGGTVDKFIGDAVMAFWGAPDIVEDHAARACRAALDIVRGLERVSRDWVAMGRNPLRARIGINSSSVLVGNIGSAERLSYTVIGDGVNVASRLEGTNKEFGSTICISDTTYKIAMEHIAVRPLQSVSVKGRRGEFMVYELLDTVPSSAELSTATL